MSLAQLIAITLFCHFTHLMASSRLLRKYKTSHTINSIKLNHRRINLLDPKSIPANGISLFLISLLALLGLFGLGCNASRSEVAYSATSTTQSTTLPTAESPNTSATPSALASDWGQPPPCHNQPQDLATWRNEITRQSQSDRFQAYLIQLRRYMPLFRDLSLEGMANLLAIPNSASAEDLRQRTLTVLWLNIISGRLNRATNITATDATAPITLAELMSNLEQAQTGSTNFKRLIALADRVNAGQQISQHVCARLMYRSGMVVWESHWSEQGFFNKDHMLSKVPLGITTFSPDYTRLVIETPRSDSGGGPLYLFDLQTDNLLNLNECVDLPNYTGVSSLKVNAWHYDNRHLLLVNEDDEVTIWLDLNAGEYIPLALDLDTNQMSPPREVALSPDGTGFTFITFSDDIKTTNLHWYSLTDHSTRLVATLPVTRGHLTAFSFSPTSQQAAYIVRRGKRSKGLSQELHLVDLNDASTRVLFSGNLGPTQPVWSPDGQHIAFTRKSLDKPDRAGPDVTPNLGNIWMISTISGETKQLTFIDKIRKPPVWSPDGKYLAFVTAEGQIGMVAVDQPGQIWRIETNLIQPQFTAIAFIP